MGGETDIFIEPQTKKELKEILICFTEENYTHFVFGNGTNFFIKDSGYEGAMIKIGNSFSDIRVEGEEIICGAGALLTTVAKAALANSLTGMEFAGGIPGSVGGAVFMNAGAYGSEMKEILSKIYLISKDGQREFELGPEELDMKYRHTAIHDTRDIVIGARFKLSKGNKEQISDKMKELTKKRNDKQPVNFPSAGSFFKRPEGYFAGKLIEDAGLKGCSIGGAEVSKLHSGFIINTGDATATDVINLMYKIQDEVYKKFGVKLEPEVRIIG